MDAMGQDFSTRSESIFYADAPTLLFLLPFLPSPKNLANDSNRKWCSRFEFLFFAQKVGGFLL